MAADEKAKAELRAAFDEMMAAIARARDAIDDPALHGPPASARNLAEGYRYLMSQLYNAIERGFFEDPHFPYVRRAVQAIAKSTIDNADAIYFSMPIDGNRRYWLRGRAADCRHWRGAPRAASGRLAPQYLIFECSSGFTGDTGSLKELAPGTRAMTGLLDVSKLAVAPDGSFETSSRPVIARVPGASSRRLPESPVKPLAHSKIRYCGARRPLAARGAPRQWRQSAARPRSQ